METGANGAVPLYGQMLAATCYSLAMWDRCENGKSVFFNKASPLALVDLLLLRGFGEGAPDLSVVVDQEESCVSPILPSVHHRNPIPQLHKVFSLEIYGVSGRSSNMQGTPRSYDVPGTTTLRQHGDEPRQRCCGAAHALVVRDIRLRESPKDPWGSTPILHHISSIQSEGDEGHHRPVVEAT